MYRVTIKYKTGNDYCCDNVSEVVYLAPTEMLSLKQFEEKSVSGDELLTHHFPTDSPLWVHHSKGVDSVSTKDIRWIHIDKEPD